MIIDHGPEIGHRGLHGPFCDDHGLGLTETVDEDCVNVVSCTVALEGGQVGSVVIWWNHQHISVLVSVFSTVTSSTIP